MSEKHICVHHLAGNCKYKHDCSKVHTEGSKLLDDNIRKKGTSVCSFYPKCIFSYEECKKIHVNPHNSGDMSEMIHFYYKILDISLTEKDKGKLEQIDKIRTLIKQDLVLLKDTYECLKSNN